MKPRARDARSLAAAIVDRTLASRRPVDELLARAGADLQPADRGFLRELVLGCLRWLRRLDAVIEQVGSRSIEAIDEPLRAPLRLAAYQLLFLDRVPPHAAVDEAVAEARRRSHRGGAGFVNAVARRISERPNLDHWPVDEADPVRRLGIIHSHPDWLVERWLECFGEQRTRELLTTNNRVKPPQILCMPAGGGRDQVAAKLAAEGIDSQPSALAPCGLVATSGQPRASRLVRQGPMYLQDVASQAAALVPPPQPGERVVDLAAAPGGKTFSLLAWESRLGIVTVDRSAARLQRLRANRRRLGLNIDIVLADALSPPFSDSFDRVVLDAPCTGTGTLRKNPELKWRIEERELRRLAAQGLAMLRSGAGLVRPGGVVSFITCSIEPEENRDVVARFLAMEPAFELVELEPLLPPELRPGVIDLGCWQVLPEDVHDGFTVHVLRRRLDST